MNKIFVSSVAVLVMCGVVFAQNTNSSTTTERPRTTNTNQAKPPVTETQKPAPAPKKPTASAQETPGSDAVLAAFNSLIEGIRHANVKEVMGSYWNSSGLRVLNYNGTVTEGGEQV